MGRGAGTTHKELRGPGSGEGGRDYTQRTEVTREWGGGQGLHTKN